ncbi:hypothetical protein [Pseudaminobacter soli (ex Li et al. 2025)]|uniref:Uncharacterized protein n=1 Tax=Pseudaminobacter soli (ex Li et al. 2025) TaxID=1295366 RepID=A0A2P7SGL1_9HYPH|nr:hypothetical protein [Mesorhizobium soli]PSJ61636.1 hypothetical protein C7I85_11435 [Mesorhizobium soli]
MKPSDPEVSLFIMNAFVEIGRTAKLRIIVDQDRLKFEDHPLKPQFDAIHARLLLMEDFERAHGPGSCIHLEEPITARDVAAGHRRFDMEEVENARRAPSAERVRILERA